MDEHRQDDLLELIYNSSVPTQNVALKTSPEQWTIETDGEKGLGRSVLAAWHDDDDDDYDDILRFSLGIVSKKKYVPSYIWDKIFNLFF